MHRLDDKLVVTTSLLRRFIAEGGEEEGTGQHFAVVQRSNGDFLHHNPHSPEAPGEQLVFIHECLTRFNNEIHHDGAWCAVLTHPVWTAPARLPEFKRFVFLWIDKDGDPQFSLDWIEGEGEEQDFSDCMLSGRDSWADRAENAWHAWHVLAVEVIDAAPDQMLKEAQGQTRPN